MDVLFHIVDDDKFRLALSNISRLLKDDGYFICSDNFIHEPTRKNLHHVNRNIEEMYTYFRNAGFDICSRKPMFFFMNGPVDSKSKILNKIWSFKVEMAIKGNVYGSILGFFFYPIEIFVLMFLKEGPSTEVVVCRKKSS